MISDILYVGETESINQRLKQHRDQRKDFSISALVTNILDKSTARLCETNLINQLKDLGYQLQNSSDGEHQLFGNANLK